MQILPIILAGGLGTRLAPLSTPERPKPFVPFLGGESLYQRTLKRVQDKHWLPPLVIGSANNRFSLKNHARECEVEPSAILLETSALGTGLAVAVAVHWATLHAPHALLAVMPSDHFIADDDQWRATAGTLCAKLIGRKRLGLMGFVPDAPCSGLGYIAADANGNVTHFVEKPANAAALLNEGNWFANAGQFFGQALAFEHVFTRHAPLVFARGGDLLKRATLAYEFMQLPVSETSAESFDRLVLEHAAPECRMENMPCGFADLGTKEQWCAYTETDWESQCAKPIRIDRPWGYYIITHRTDARVEKILTIYPNARLSLQRHRHRSEDWQIVSGHARVLLEGVMHTLQEGDALHVPAGAWHRLENAAGDVLVIEEVQSGAPDEEDIERVEDDFGRAQVNR